MSAVNFFHRTLMKKNNIPIRALKQWSFQHSITRILPTWTSQNQKIKNLVTTHLDFLIGPTDQKRP
jgi:hypothetical protein